MSHVGVEYAILLPILILQIIVLPLSASWLMGVWTNDRLQGEIQEAASQVTSSIKQLYLALMNPNVVLTSGVNQTLNLPKVIESYMYYATGPQSGSYAILNLDFTLQGAGISTNSSVVFGSNVYWQSSEFSSSNSSQNEIDFSWNNTMNMISFKFV